MTFDDLIKYFGNTYQINVKAGLSSGCAFNWKKQGFVPFESQERIELMFKGRSANGVELVADKNHCNKKGVEID